MCGIYGAKGGSFVPGRFNQSVIDAFAWTDDQIMAKSGSVTGALAVENKFYVLTAAAYQELSWHMINKYHYMVKWLTDGIGTRGQMAADGNKDHYLTLKELYNYVAWKGENTPILSRSGGSVNTRPVNGKYHWQHAQAYPSNSNFELFYRK